MITLRRFAKQAPSIPAATTWYLADVAQALGKQELFTKQAPQKLKALRSSKATRGFNYPRQDSNLRPAD